MTKRISSDRSPDDGGGKSTSETKTEMAEDRTDWAEDRTILANERTFAGWMRTGLGTVGIAVALHAVFGETEPTWHAKSVASLFLLLAIAIFLLARRQAGALIARLDAHAAAPVSAGYMSWLSLGLAIATCGVGVILWLI